MARKSQVKAIAARAKHSPVVPPVALDESPGVATATLTRAAKKKHVKRAKSLTKTAPSPMAVRMQQDLQLTGRGQATQDSYLRAVRKLAVFARKSPDLIDEEELRAYPSQRE